MPRRYHRKGSVKKTMKRHHKKIPQKGGAGYTLTDCRIGGLSEVRAYSECPQNVGPGSADFANSLYSAPVLFSGQAGGSHRKSRTQRRKAANCRR
jgi:hypothetical protein